MHRRHHFVWIILLGCLCWAGCERKASFSDDVTQLETVFSLTSASPEAGDPSTYKDAKTPALVKSLVDAMRRNDMDTAALTLHVLNFRGTGLTYEQFNAIRLTFGDVSAELAGRAAHGDEHAKDLMQKMSP